MRGLNPGDLVLLKREPPEKYRMWPLVVDNMEPFFGLIVTVARSKFGDSDTTFRIKEDRRKHSWSYWMIERMASENDIIPRKEGC